METPADLWRDLTTMALRLIKDLEDEGAPLDVESIVDAALDAYANIPDVQKSRTRLTAFVRDMIGGHGPSTT